MIAVNINTTSMQRKLNNLVEYSLGFLEGVESGKKIFFDQLGKGVIEALGQYIDVMARADEKALHHVYEWSQVGQRSGRLFNFTTTVTGAGIALNATFSQSKTVKDGSNTPFYNKAKIMESGTAVTIKPRGNNPLVFESNGETIFTKRPILNQFPGGQEVTGSFERVFDTFMRYYFTQSFLRASGLSDYLETPTIFKRNLAAGIRGGKGIGRATGMKWIINAKVSVE
jgi:hypothetical protein